MAREPVLRGYLLEECLAWLLRGSGYRLLVSVDDDPVELRAQGQELRVRGRGTSHQVDVLGELAFTPAFSLPARMFLEAKFYSTPCRLEVVRNAHGVIDDVNENYATRSTGDGPPLRRFHYTYALFSASGFTADAGEYALAQQISLIDLSLPAFDWLLEPIAHAAGRLYRRQQRFNIASFPVSWMRVRLRDLLGTVPAADLPEIETGAPLFAAAAEKVLVALADALHAPPADTAALGLSRSAFRARASRRGQGRVPGVRREAPEPSGVHPAHRR